MRHVQGPPVAVASLGFRLFFSLGPRPLILHSFSHPPPPYFFYFLQSSLFRPLRLPRQTLLPLLESLPSVCTFVQVFCLCTRAFLLFSCFWQAKLLRFGERIKIMALQSRSRRWLLRAREFERSRKYSNFTTSKTFNLNF